MTSFSPLIMKLAMPVSPYPTFPRKREKGQTNRYASFTLKQGFDFPSRAAIHSFSTSIFSSLI